MKKILLPALALGAMSSTALAEPMTLTDGEMDRVAAGQFFLTVDKDVFKTEFVDVFKFFDTFSFVQGISAHAQAGAQAFGTAAHSQTLTATFADEFGFTEAFSESLSQAGD